MIRQGRVRITWDYPLARKRECEGSGWKNQRGGGGAQFIVFDRG
jgi:hypothetical protein